MAEVLQVPRQPDGQSFYQSSGLRRSSPSSSSLFLDSSPRPSTPKPASASGVDPQDRSPTPPAASRQSPSPYPSLWDLSDGPTLESRLTSRGLSLDNEIDFDSNDSDIEFPNYDHVHFDSVGPDSSAASFTGESSDEQIGSTTDTTISNSPLPTPTVLDDTAVKLEPSSQVDFLSHDWREEDIWSSWRHIVSQRKSVYGERSRLENASWRTWAKSKYKLRTVAPERLNWLKESDVTWLYGPLKPASSYPITHDIWQPSSQVSKNNSFLNKKPILKKRSVSEAMLQKSLSNSSLVQQAAASVQAQGRQSRKSSFTTTDEESSTRDQMDYFNSRTTSGSATPFEASEKRHIRFDDRVEQCIAVELKDAAVDEDDEFDPEGNDVFRGSDSSSDDGLVMKKPSRRLTAANSQGKTSRSNSLPGRKTIETLPATTLKDQTDNLDAEASAQHHTFGRSWSTGKLSPSPSQETLRPSHPSSNFLLVDENDDDADIDANSTWSFGSSNPKSSLGASASASDSPDRLDGVSSTRKRSGTGPISRHNDYEFGGMRRTESGMLMPYSDDDEEDEIAAQGLFGRVSDAIKTARDVSYVIWNVGWRT